jgi:hypothetical protein
VRSEISQALASKVFPFTWRSRSRSRAREQFRKPD